MSILDPLSLHLEACATDGEKGNCGKGKAHFVFSFAHPTCKTKKRDRARLGRSKIIKLKRDK